MKLQALFACFITANTALPSAEPILSSRQASRVNELIGTITTIVEQLDTAVQSFTCDPRDLFAAQFHLQLGFRAVISSIKEAGSVTLTESPQIQEYTARLQHATETFVNHVEAKKPVFDTFGLTIFMVSQLHTQRFGMFDFDQALVDRMSEEAKNAARKLTKPIFNALDVGIRQMGSWNATEARLAGSLPPHYCAV